MCVWQWCSEEITKYISDNLPYAFCEQIGKEIRDISDEIPFEIPDSWEWVRLGIISTYNQTKQKINAKDADVSIWGLDLEDIEKGGRLLVKKTVGERKAVGDKTVFTKGDILYSKLRPYLLKILVAPDSGICTPEIVPFTVYGGISAEYIVNFLKSPYVDGLVNGETYGIKMPRAGTDTMISLLVPLPPINEQHRIVAKIEALLPYIERYGKAEEHLTTLNTTFPEALKKSILQEAVQGKLVPQNPDDEPASVLLERIRAEKQALIKQGKIKKNKNESVIITRDKIPYEIINGKERCLADEVPFEIPDSWCWCRWGTISESIQYGYNAPAKENGRIKMVRISDIQDNKVLWDTVPFCDIDEESIETYLLKQNDILFARTGGTVGKSYLVKEVPKDAIYAGYLIRTRYSNNLSPEYLKFFMESELYWIQLRNGTIATAQPNCNGKTLANMLVPIPPLAEQKRIVAKIEEIMPMIERLTLR